MSKQTLTPGAAHVKDFLSDAAHGRVLMLTTAGLHHMTSDAIAVLHVRDYLEECRHGSTTLIGGNLPDLVDLPFASRYALSHELRWLASNDALMQLYSKQTQGTIAPTHLLFMDPWALSLSRSWSATAIRALLWDGVPQDCHESYWKDLLPWMEQFRCDLTFTSGQIFEALGAAWWLGIQSSSSHKQDQLLRCPQPVIIEESLSLPAQPERLAAFVAKWPSPWSRILITPHRAVYAEYASVQLASFTHVLEPAELTPTIYARLLGRAATYSAPDGLPWGPAVLRLLPESTPIHLRPVDMPLAHRPTIAVAHHRLSIHARDPYPSTQSRISAIQHPVPQPHVEDVLPEATLPSDTLARWWSQLPAEPHSLMRNTIARDNGPARPDISILVVCYKYLQRFRIFLQSLVRQRHPLHGIQLCVAAPGNPDGLLEYLTIVRMAHPALTIHVVDIAPGDSTNKGKMLNAAFRVSTAPLIMVSDVDLVFGPEFIEHMLAEHRPERILGCWRTPMNKDITAHILCGNLDPIEHFETLRQQWDHDEYTGGVRQGMLGYCQIVAREAFERVGYPEEFDGYNQSDVVFIDRLNRIGLQNHFLKDHFVLHLSHLRDWAGTKVFL